MGVPFSLVFGDHPPSLINNIVPFSFWEKYRDKDSGDIPIIGENPLRYHASKNWSAPMSYKYDHTYRYVLMEAICNDRVEEVKKVLDLDFDPKRIVCPERGLDAVNLASMLHRPHILKYLLLRGGSLEGRDKEGNTPLMNAVRNWQFENLKILVEGGSDIEAVD